MGDADNDTDTHTAGPVCTYGLYVHIPFCKAKCGYCDFYSVAGNETAFVPVIDGILRELDHRVAESEAAAKTLFVGGGTPTILPAKTSSILFSGLSRLLPPGSLSEFTVEANPGTVDDEKAEILAAGGVNRVSMGAQSFVASELAILEREHSPDDIAAGVATLRRHGIRQLNLDLIFGLPGQSVASWSESLARAVELEPDHIACYGLTYEVGTRLTAMRDSRRIDPVDEGLEAEMYVATIDQLAEVGYAQYEISNFARPGCECQHNVNYWRNGPYIGVGPSAVGCMAGRRYKNVSDVEAYVRMIGDQGQAEVESETLDRSMLITEMVMMQLRLVEGLSRRAFSDGIGVDPVALFGDKVDRLVELELVTVSPASIALTKKGRLLSDAVMVELIEGVGPDEDESPSALQG